MIKPMKTRHRFLLSSIPILFSLFSIIFFMENSNSEKPGKPTIAIVDFIKGFISKRLSETGQSTKISQKEELVIQNIIEVPRSSGTDENWVHLQFKKGRSHLNPLVQIGPDSDDTDYIFPCNYSSGGGLWGVSKLSSNSCNRIVVKKKGQLVTQKKSKQTKGSSNIFMAQADSEQFTVEPKGNSTLIYIHQDTGNTVVDVLTGSVRIGITTVRGGIRYVDAGSSRRGDTIPIQKEVYDSRPVQIFLDSNNWSENVRFDIQGFQEAVELQKSRPPESNTEGINIPEKPTQSPPTQSPPTQSPPTQSPPTQSPPTQSPPK